jgi:predicted metal-dependent phosphotriesterase family hydrolase
MTKILTMLGPISPDKLGFTDAHGHLIMDRDLIVRKYPDFKIADVDKVIEEVGLFMKAGGGAMVEMSPIGCGRNPRAMLEIAEKTGLNVVASTGIQKSEFYLDSHWRFFYTAEQMAEIFLEEITEGMDANSYNGPFVDRLKARAGVIKVATPYQHIAPSDERTFEAAAIAHRETGAPISSHTENGTMGFEQVELIKSFGVAPEHFTVGHMDRNPDLYTHMRIAETGAYLLYDTPSRVKYFPESTFVELVQGMVEAGFGKQLVWGGDLARKSYLAAYGGGPGMAYVPDQFVKRLKDQGFTQEVIDDIFIHNPARALTFAH